MLCAPTLMRGVGPGDGGGTTFDGIWRLACGFGPGGEHKRWIRGRCGVAEVGLAMDCVVEIGGLLVLAVASITAIELATMIDDGLTRVPEVFFGVSGGLGRAFAMAFEPSLVFGDGWAMVPEDSAIDGGGLASGSIVPFKAATMDGDSLMVVSEDLIVAGRRYGRGLVLTFEPYCR